MTDYEFILEDRIAKIRAINEQYDLEHNSYLSFSGGKDSTVLHYLLDIALPNNNIPRVYANTGIEYIEMVKFVKSLAKTDKRFIILNQNRNIRLTLNEYGYPFKSKEHSSRVYQFNKGSKAPYLIKYLSSDCSFRCPQILRYQFENVGYYNYSDKCCRKLKKDLIFTWSKFNKKNISITGIRNSEGGNRSKLTCLTNNGKKFHPLVVVSDDWEQEFINVNNIKLCKLYYSPYNFKRTGCKGCPFNLDLQQDLNKIFVHLPNEYKQIISLWKPVYDEYIRIGYRLKYYPHEKGVQMDIFDLMDYD